MTRRVRGRRDEVRALAARLQFEREDERAVIAREIHDDLGQMLTSVQLGLAWIARAVTPGPPRVQAKVRSLSALVTATIRSVRRIAVELRPGPLDELGLAKTLRLEARAFKAHTGVPCRFETNLGRARCGRAGGVAVFRIAQAALTNVARHARASRAVMTLMKRRTDLVLTVHDNGRGMTAPSVHRHDSFGITGMRERAIALDGTLTLAGARGTGTTVTVRIPLSQILLTKDLRGPSRAGRRSGATC